MLIMMKNMCSKLSFQVSFGTFECRKRCHTECCLPSVCDVCYAVVMFKIKQLCY